MENRERVFKGARPLAEQSPGQNLVMCKDSRSPSPRAAKLSFCQRSFRLLAKAPNRGVWPTVNKQSQKERGEDTQVRII